MDTSTSLPTLGIGIVMNDPEEAALVAASISTAVMRMLQLSVPYDFLPSIRRAERYTEPVEHLTLHLFLFPLPKDLADQLPPSLRALFISSCRSWHRAPTAAAMFEHYIETWLRRYAHQLPSIARIPVVSSNPHIAVFQKIEASPTDRSSLELL